MLNLFCRSREAKKQLTCYRAQLYRVAYAWSHNASLADDLVQETLTKAMRKASQLRDPNAAKAWLFSILANCYRDHFRRYRETEDIDNMRLVHETTPELENSRLETVTKVRTNISKLPDGQRQVITLVDLEEFSYAETANILNIPIGTVMSRLCRARNALRKHLLAEFGEHAAAKEPRIRRVK